MPRARATARRGGTASDTQKKQQESEKERGVLRWWKGMGEEEVNREVGEQRKVKTLPCMYLVYREKTTTATRAYKSAKPRVGEPRIEPLTDSKVRRQSGRFSCLRTPELFGRVLQR